MPNVVTVEVGTGTNLSGLPTYRDLSVQGPINRASGRPTIRRSNGWGRPSYFVVGGTRVICQVNVYSCVSPGMVSGNLTVLPPES